MQTRIPSLVALALALAPTLTPAHAGDYACCSHAELTYSNGDVELAGLVLEPYAEGDFPGAVILQGAGDSDRSNAWARLIAETIAAEGFAVLLTDKRGSGRSGGDWWTASFEDLARDALAGVDALRRRDHVRSDLVGLVGLSQGGHVAPLAATMGEVEFVISLVSGAVRMDDSLFHELEQTYRQVGLTDAQIAELQVLTALSFRYISTGDGFADYLGYRDRMTRKYGARATQSWPATPDHRYWTFWGHIHDFDSIPYWRRVVDELGIPSFIGYGELDEHDNVPVKRSVERLEESLEGAALTLRVYPGTGHSLMDGGGLVDDLVADLDAWLDGVVAAHGGAVAPAASPRAAVTESPPPASVDPAIGPTILPAVWTLDRDLCEPETVVHDRHRAELYVSNICGFAPNGEGYLSRVSLEGEMLEDRWIEGLDSPAGMFLFGDHLYVADYRRVTVVDVAAGTIVERRPVAGARALNDIAVADDGTIWLSDSALGAVLRVDGDGAARYPAGAMFEDANGLHLEDGTLWVGGKHLWRIDTKTRTVAPIAPRAPAAGLGDIDGIEGDGDGGLVVSVVGGPVWHLPREGEPTVWATEGLGSANHLYLAEGRLVIVPTGFDGRVIAFRLP